MTEKELIKAHLKAQTIFDANNTMMDVKSCAEFLECNQRTVLNRINNPDHHNHIIAEYVGGWRIPKLQFYEKLIAEFDSNHSTSLEAV